MKASNWTDGGVLVPWMARAGGALIGSLFLVSGILKMGRLPGIAAAIGSKSVPLADGVAIVVVALEVLGGLALIAGWQVRRVAAVLALFVVAATLLFHAFWAADPAAFQNQLNHFLKNVAIVGGLLLAWAGAGGRAN